MPKESIILDRFDMELLNRFNLLIVILFVAASSYSQLIPSPTGNVSDFENIYTETEARILDSLISDIEVECSIEIAVVTLDSVLTSLDDFDVYTLQLANDWGIGKKGENNGILIGISSSFRKMRIENGYGIEKRLSNQETKTIIDSLFIPEFKKGDYYEGTRNGLLGIMTQLEINDSKLRSDSLVILAVDNYPIDDSLFKGNYGMIESGEIHSIDKAWFTNDELQQTLIIELYTDYHRSMIYCFDSKNIPSALLRRMYLYQSGNKIATYELKEKHLKGLVSQAIKLERSRFVSNEGISIGMFKANAKARYGSPDKRAIEEGLEVLEWEYVGDTFYDPSVSPQKNVIAKDSYGHTVTMFFKADKLVGYILNNHIP
jgi:hypothetical protein